MEIKVFGDWHGNKVFADRVLKDSESDLYLHVGDFGVWEFYDPKSQRQSFLKVIEDELAEQGKELWFIDGNHENFHILNSLPKDDRGLGVLSPHIYHIPRGYVWELDGIKFMGLGGAVSIDRGFRREGWDYFKDEEITSENLEKALSAGSVDVLLTHDSPILPVPSRSFGPGIDRDNNASRDAVAEVAAALEPKLLIHGHYHYAYVGQFLTTTVYGLGADINPPSQNSLLINSEELNI